MRNVIIVFAVVYGGMAVLFGLGFAAESCSRPEPVPVVPAQAPAPPAMDASTPEPRCTWRDVEPLSAAVPSVGILRLVDAVGPGGAHYDAATQTWWVPRSSGLALRIGLADGEHLEAVRVELEDAPGGPVKLALARWRGGVRAVTEGVHDTKGEGFYEDVRLDAVLERGDLIPVLVLERGADKSSTPARVYRVRARIRGP